MTIEAKLDQIIASLATLTAPAAVDISGLATSAEVAALAAQVTALAGVVGTEPVPAPTPAPVTSGSGTAA